MPPAMRFGPFQLDRDERLLFRDGVLVSLPPRALDLLLLLAEAEGRLVTKAEILERVWQGAFVEEANIAHQISAIRRALEEGHEGGRYIETLPRRGYRFIGNAVPVERSVAQEGELSSVTVVDESRRLTITEEEDRFWTLPRMGLTMLALLVMLAGAVVWHAGSRSHPEIHSLAVLPFTLLDRTPQDAYLSLGMAEALVNRLSALPGVTVRPITAVAALPHDLKGAGGLGSLLEVDALLEGTVQRDGDRLRVTTRLIRAGDGVALWSGKFDEQSASLFALQDTISERVAKTLVPTIQGQGKSLPQKRSTEDPEAYDLYMRGRAQWSTFSPTGLGNAIEFYQAALEKDPRFVLAWAGLADAYSVIGIYGPLPPAEAFGHSRDAALKALALDPDSPDAVTALGVIDLLYARNWEPARLAFARTLRIKEDFLVAHTMTGYYLQAAGRPEESLIHFRRAIAIDPVWRIPQRDLLHGLLLARRYEEAISASDALLARAPLDYFAITVKGCSLAQLGRAEEALRILRSARGSGSMWPRSEEAWLLARSGDRAGALRIAEAMKEANPNGNQLSFYLAVLYAGLGDRDESFRLLDQAVTTHSAFVFRFALMPELDSLRSDPRFAALVERLHLPR